MHIKIQITDAAGTDLGNFLTLRAKLFHKRNAISVDSVPGSDRKEYHKTLTHASDPIIGTEKRNRKK